MSEKLNKSVYISRQFLRSINLEADLGRTDALQGYICQETAMSLINIMAQHINNTRQRAFTWTGPYGGGKSSLALILGSLVSSNKIIKSQAKKIIGFDSSNVDVKNAWSSTTKGWLVIPVVGKRDSVIETISNALDKKIGTISKKPKSSDLIIRLLNEASSRKNDGVLLIIDELGKFLESSALTGEDIYFYQELAEAASRSEGKLIIVGILHQAFEQYAIKLGRDTRDEWAKIQGRYIDIPLVSATDEVIELVGNAIIKNPVPDLTNVSKFYYLVSELIIKRRPNVSLTISKSLLKCWPLHPVTAALIGPISRKKFSQNERSIFGFLASGESIGFTEFLNNTPLNEYALYSPSRYWDYLKINFEQSIIASSDGHRWAMSNDAIERTEARYGCTENHVKLAKTIALIDMFRASSGLVAEDTILNICIENTPKTEINNCLQDLARWSIIAFRKHLNSWTIYSGSDFDIDLAVTQARAEIGDVNIKQLIELSELNPIVAKKHFHETGTLRWYSRSLVRAESLEEYINKFIPKYGSAGEFILIAPSNELSVRQIKNLIIKISKLESTLSCVIGYADNADKIQELGMELSSLERVQKNRTELESDSVARKEVLGRVNFVKSELSEELKSSFDNGIWFNNGLLINKEMRTNLSSIASKIASDTYPKTIKIHNELVNKESISGNAVKARRELMYHMLRNYGQEKLGYEGFSSDAGIFYSIIDGNNLYHSVDDKFVFNISNHDAVFAKYFSPLWETFEKLLKSNEKVTLTTLYHKWQAPPIGAKSGVLPIFSLIYYLANRHKLALYIENTYITELTEAFLDEWMQDTDRISFKYIEITADREELLRSLSKSLTIKLGSQISANPLESARALVNLVATLPLWTKRTLSVSKEAQELRRLLLKANDPYKVLFTDLPVILNADNQILVDKVSTLTEELQQAYSTMLNSFKEIMFRLVDHRDEIINLNHRAEQIKGLTGDFKIDAFVARLSVFKNDTENLEGLLSTTINKNPRDWVDRDRELALNELMRICSTFRKIEAYGSLRQRNLGRRSFAFVYSDPAQQTISENFDVSMHRLPQIEKIANEMLNNLNKLGFTKDEILATFADACSKTLENK